MTAPMITVFGVSAVWFAWRAVTRRGIGGRLQDLGHLAMSALMILMQLPGYHHLPPAATALLLGAALSTPAVNAILIRRRRRAASPTPGAAALIPDTISAAAMIWMLLIMRPGAHHTSRGASPGMAGMVMGDSVSDPHSLTVLFVVLLAAAVLLHGRHILQHARSRPAPSAELLNTASCALMSGGMAVAMLPLAL